MKVFKWMKNRKEKYFPNWMDFILSLGVAPLEDGGFIIAIYFWGGLFAVIIGMIMFKSLT